MTIKIKHKRGTASSITTANPTLAAGELAFETDTRRFKVGDGTTAWSSLSYVTPYVTATDRILGRSSAGAGAAEEISCGSFGRSLIGSADAAAARTTLSVQPTASPAFTGAATVTNDGNVVPLTVTNTGTANSFVVNDASGDTSPFVIDASGNVGIGITPTSLPLTVFSFATSDADKATLLLNGTVASGQSFAGIRFTHNVFSTGWAADIRCVDTGNFGGILSFRTSATGSATATPTERLKIDAAGVSTFSGQLLVTAGSASACGVAFSGDPDTGIAQLSAAGANTLSICTNSAERVRVGSGGNVAIGAIDPQTALHIDKNADGALVILRGAQTANTQHILFRNPFHTNNGSAGTAFVGAQDTGSSGGNLIFATTTNGSGASGTPTERVRVDASGNLLINTTSADPGGTNASSGMCLAPSSYISVSRSDGASLILNRKTTDGILAAFYQEGALEGDIAVAGNTISYNAFCGSHWAQLIDGSRPAILRGTVLETIDEMCEWPGEPKNDRLPRVKVSDTPRSRRVYGVFMAWDDEYAATGDMYATALGAYMVRVSGTVQSGDLLESAGDGTARTQSDDIVRSSTIGKVSSTHRVAEYDDGSYLVPCVLMCG